MKPTNYFWIGAAVAVLGCASSLPHVSPMQAQWAAQRYPGMDVEMYEQARKLYVKKCSRCHNVVLPAKLSMEKWQRMIDKMAPKAKLKGNEKDLIWAYIVTVHEAPVDNK